LITVNITFTNGQYFDPKIGWLSEKPKPPTPAPEPPLPVSAIDDSMAYVVDEQMQNIIDRFKANREALRQKSVVRADESADHHVLLSRRDGFLIQGNSMSVNVDLSRSYYLSDSVDFYEEKRSEILGMKDAGYCDDAINMLLEELDSQFASHACRGLSEQLQVEGYKENTARDMSLQFNKAYLMVRKTTDLSSERSVRAALEKMGLSHLDPDFGKRGHYGRAGRTRHFLFPSAVESHFKSVEMMENWSRNMEREERNGELVASVDANGKPTLRRRDGKDISVPTDS
jgi:hypothetical protein